MNRYQPISELTAYLANRALYLVLLAGLGVASGVHGQDEQPVRPAEYTFPTGELPSPLVGMPELPSGPLIAASDTVPEPVIDTAPDTAPANKVRPDSEPNKAQRADQTTPNILIETKAPARVAFDEPFDVTILLRNLGRNALSEVIVSDTLPEATELIASDPPAKVAGRSASWEISELPGGGERQIVMRLKSNAPKVVQSRPKVTFASHTSMEVEITRPKLELKVDGPKELILGKRAEFTIQLQNQGTGTARNLVLGARLSSGLEHPQGTVIEAELKELKPGESREITLAAVAIEPGEQSCDLKVDAAGCEEQSARSRVMVIRPQLVIRQQGPVRCLVGGEAVFKLDVTNPMGGTTEEVILTGTLPEGTRFIAAEGGTYDEVSRGVSWKLAVTPGTTRELSFKVQAVAEGTWKIPSRAQAEGLLDATAESELKVEGIPALRFEVIDLIDVIPVGDETIYEISVVNQGTGACTNIQLMAELSEGLTVTDVTAPVKHEVTGRRLTFEPFPRLAGKADLVIRVKVRGDIEGDQRFRVSLSSEQFTRPLIKEESTRFYKALK